MASTKLSTKTKNSGVALATSRKTSERKSLDRWRWTLICTSGILLALSFPPFGLGLTAFVALVPWTILICHPVPVTGRQYFGLWCVGFVFWLWVLESIRKAHPALYLGWVALSGYLAVYIPGFVAWSRMLVHKGKWPAWLAIPVVWTALELVRAYMITGFSMANLGHALVAYPALIQLASVGGAYAVGFVVALVGAALGCALFQLLRPLDGTIASSPLAPQMALVGQSMAVLTIVLVAAIATFVVSGRVLPQVGQAKPSEQKPFRVAVVQGALDVVFEISDEQAGKVATHYRDTIDGGKKHFADRAGRPPTLYLLPESSFPRADFEMEQYVTVPRWHEGTLAEFKTIIQRRHDVFEEDLKYFVSGLRLPRGLPHYVMLGSAKVVYADSPVPTITNEAVLVDEKANVVSSYSKCHPVMFGEYLPFGAWFPWIYQIAPLPAGITAGPGAKPFEIDGLVFSPSICFESTVPHVIASHVRECRAKGKEIDALVNITNDGWFWGGAILDLQAQCNIMRAVEHGKPMFVAANTGLSMIVDSNGHIIKQAPRRVPQVLVETVSLGGRAPTLYSRTGDIFAASCLVAGVIGKLLAGRTRRRK